MNIVLSDFLIRLVFLIMVRMIFMLAMAHITRNLIVIVIFKIAVFYWSLGQFFKLPKFISTVSIFNLMKAGIPHLTLI